MTPRVVMFDIDQTLAESKQAIVPSMAKLLSNLLAHAYVGIISGGKLEQFITQIVTRLPETTDLSRLYLLPTSGAALYIHTDAAWQAVYEENLTPDEASRITTAIEEAIEETGILDLSIPSYGERIEFRGAQVTLSALGQDTPLALKSAWDPDQKKRSELRAVLIAKLPHYDVKIGGTNSIDITKHGINKAYGVRKLSEMLLIPIEEMLYIGDALYPGGNDEVVKETGIRTHAVANPAETETYITHLLESTT